MHVHGPRPGVGWPLAQLRRGDRSRRVRRIEQNPPIEQSGNRIQVGPRERSERWNGVSVSYVITVPANAQVMARSGSGDLEVGDVAGPVDLSTGSGDIRIGRATERA